MIEQLTNGWQEILAPQEQEAYYQKLMQFVNEQYETSVVYPKKSIFLMRYRRLIMMK